MTDKIAIFYHIYQVNHWEKLFEHQIISLQQSGVYDAAEYIHFGINGNLPLPYNLIKVNSVKRNTNVNSECDTLYDLYKFCIENPEFKVLYLHTKGVSYPEGHSGQTSWLRYLDFFNVKRWRECVELLNTHDCVGTEWSTKHPDNNMQVSPHYAGNFWWANSNYINKLDANYLYNTDHKLDLKSIGSDERHNAEFWIGTGNPNYFNYYSTNKNKYREVILSEEYENIKIQNLINSGDMAFEFRIIYRKFWSMLETAIREVYGHTEKERSLVSLGTYTIESAEKIKERSGGRKVIVYQAEPLVQNHWWNTDHLIEKIRNADEIWDYDLQNVQLLRNRGLNVKFRPPLFAKSLKTVKNVENPDIDVLFYGVLTPFRSKIIYDLVEGVSIPEEFAEIYLNMNTVVLWNIHSEQLDHFIGRSKIILNLNPYDGECRQQQTRIFYNLINNKCVLSQKNKINYYGDMIVEFADVQDMFNKIIDLLRNDKWKTYGSNNFEQISQEIIKDPERYFSHLLENNNEQ